MEATQGVAKNFSVIMLDSTTGLGAALTGPVLAGLTVRIKKGGVLSYLTITPTLNAVGNTGLLDLALTGSHFDTLGVAAVNITGAGVRPNNDLFIDVIAIDKNDAVRGGMSALPAADAGTTLGLPLSQDIENLIANLPLPTDILDALLVNHSSIGSAGDALALAAGLLQGNFFMDTVSNDGNGQTAARLRLFRGEGLAGAATDGGSGEGEFATFLVTTTYSAPGKVLTHRVIRVIET